MKKILLIVLLSVVSVKMFAYEPYVPAYDPNSVKVGDRMNYGGAEWKCVRVCRVYDIEEKLPPVVSCVIWKIIYSGELGELEYMYIFNELMLKKYGISNLEYREWLDKVNIEEANAMIKHNEEVEAKRRELKINEIYNNI